MRPRRLELEGFASFREPARIDFDDADLFVLTGATGAGKSSVLDAMIFALYGSVPRYENPSLVAPVVTQGRSEAKVRLDFSVGPAEYTAVRVVRRTTSGGATTREARLERIESGEPVVVAGNAREVTQKVEEILGLGFDHFVRCVVLPQGAFSAFLRATPGERQELLIQLLDLGLYRQMRQMANARAAERKGTAEHLRRQLAEEHGHATAQAVHEAKRRAQELEALARKLRLEAPALEAAEAAARLGDERARESRKLAAALRALERDPEAAGLADELAGVAADERRAESARGEAAAALDRERSALAHLPPEADLARLLELAGRRVRVAGEVAELATRVASARQASVSAAESSRERAAAHAAAERELEAARAAHQAADLASGLGPGDPCPVCGRPLAAAPAIEAADLESRRERAAAARRAAEEARAGAEGAARELARSEERQAAAAEALGALDATLDGAPPPGEVELRLAEVRAAAAAVRRAEAAWAEAEAARSAARDRREALAERLSGAWRRFDEVRDTLAVLEPPPTADRENLEGAWAALEAWAVETTPALEAAARAAAEEAAERRAEVEEGLRGWLAAARAAGVEEAAAAAGIPGLREALAATAARAVAQAEALAASLERAKELRRRAKQAETEAAVASELGRLLSANGFERWLLERALARLTEGASRILLELSSGQYSLVGDAKGGFEVVDHTNADEPRSTKTLSGGETFLASLALALALAEDVSRLAARGVARLEALFLDEGFGSLDPETLDVVAGAIEGLGAQGRMVGIVTHVRELAERIPVRFEVTKDARTSSVRREG